MGSIMGSKSSKQETEISKYCLPDKTGAFFELKNKPDSLEEALEFKYIDKTQISHDTFIYTYEIKNNLTLGLNLGHHLAIDAVIKTKDNPEGEAVSRKYTPISTIDSQGQFKLLVKVYFKDVHPQFPDGGRMSQYLNDLEIGDSIKARGPFGKLTYLGEGNFKILKKFKPLTYLDKNFKKVAMLAGGTGITPMYQILQAANKNKDITEFTLIFGNKTTQDVLLKKELEEIQQSGNLKFTLHFLIDKTEPGWSGLVGYVNQEMITTHFPAPSDDTLLLVCGPPVMCEKSKELFQQLSYNKDNIFEF